MASNHTTHYDLSQWQPTDEVVRTDFNADNAKIDAALNGLAKRTERFFELVKEAVLEEEAGALSLSMDDFDWNSCAVVCVSFEPRTVNNSRVNVGLAGGGTHAMTTSNGVTLPHKTAQFWAYPMYDATRTAFYRTSGMNEDVAESYPAQYGDFLKSAFINMYGEKIQAGSAIRVWALR